MKQPKRNTTISRGAEILKALSEGYGRLEDIYPMVGLSKSTTHRLLQILVSAGLAFQNPLNRNYHIGPLILELASIPTVSHQVLILSSIDELRQLRKATNETTSILIPVGDQRLVLKELPSKQSISFSFGEGRAMPIYVGSSGRVILSQYTDKELDKILSKINILPISPNTITDRILLKKEIDKIRKNGFDTTSGEILQDGAGISVPVKGYVCPVAISVIGPKSRFNPESVLDKIKETGSKISNKLKINQDY